MSEPSTEKSRLRRILAIGGAVAVVVAIAFFLWRSTWVQEQAWTPQEAFLYGSIGTEFAPLSVFWILPDLFPDQFQPDGEERGDWIDQFGFIRGTPGINRGLPIGFTVSNYSPVTGSPSPVEFVGVSCSACHTNVIKRSADDEGVLVYGMGSTSVDFFAWGDALRTTLLDEERLDTQAIEDAYSASFGTSLGLVEKLVIRFWLSGAREALQGALPKYDAPFGGLDLRDSRLMPIGPGRSQAFKSLVQIAMDRPGATDRAYSKLPAIYQQGRKELAQFDGSARNLVLRSALAALGSGATLETLAVPAILDDIRKASDYTVDLSGPSYREVFPDLPIDPEVADRGRGVYMRFCADCHGYPDPAGGDWLDGARLGEIVPLEEIGTDRERVSYRYYESIAQAMYDYFPDDHPLNPEGDDLRQEGEIGFLSAPLQSVFTLAPYLHNGAVSTLAELINLKPRREVFYRGRVHYDPFDVGLISPEAPEPGLYYRFDTTDRGNGKGGHDYPWTYRGPGWDEDALKDLLEYLKTI